MMRAVTITCTVQLLDGSEHDVDIKVGIWGRHRAATRRDPSEAPEAEIRAVRLLTNAPDAIGIPMLADEEIPLSSVDASSLGDWSHDALEAYSDECNRERGD